MTTPVSDLRNCRRGSNRLRVGWKRRGEGPEGERNCAIELKSRLERLPVASIDDPRHPETAPHRYPPGYPPGEKKRATTENGLAAEAAKPLILFLFLVGTAGFELATPCTPFRSQAVFGRPLLSPLK